MLPSLPSAVSTCCCLLPSAVSKCCHHCLQQSLNVTLSAFRTWRRLILRLESCRRRWTLGNVTTSMWTCPANRWMTLRVATHSWDMRSTDSHTGSRSVTERHRLWWGHWVSGQSTHSRVGETPAAARHLMCWDEVCCASDLMKYVGPVYFWNMLD